LWIFENQFFSTKTISSNIHGGAFFKATFAKSQQVLVALETNFFKLAENFTTKALQFVHFFAIFQDL
jgi:hypothetical protein